MDAELIPDDLPTDPAELRRERERCRWAASQTALRIRRGQTSDPEQARRRHEHYIARRDACNAILHPPPPPPPPLPPIDPPADWWIAHFDYVPPVNRASGWCPPNHN